MAKVPEPQAIQKLLHTRTAKLSPTDSTCIKEVDDSTQADNNAENVLSKFWEERKNSDKSRKPFISGILPNKYQPEPVVTKIAFGGMYKNLFACLEEFTLENFCGIRKNY